MFCSQEGKIGEPTVPREDQNSIIKGKDGLRRTGSEKKRGKKKRFSKKSINKSVVKRKKTLKGKTNIASRYPVKATIAHTRIQRESNFANFEG